MTDLLHPKNVFDGTQENFAVNSTVGVTSIADFMTKMEANAASNGVDGEGVFVLDEVILSVSGQEIKSQKVAIVTKVSVLFLFPFLIFFFVFLLFAQSFNTRRPNRSVTTPVTTQTPARARLPTRSAKLTKPSLRATIRFS